MKNKKPYYESDNPTKVIWGVSWRVWIWLICSVVGIGVISAGVWWFKVATSDIKGAGDATRKINSAQNRIAAQETFEALYQDILKYDRNLDQAALNRKNFPKEERYIVEYTGMVQICQDAISQYNANANKVSQGKWISSNLPPQIDMTNVATDCKENGVN